MIRCALWMRSTSRRSSFSAGMVRPSSWPLTMSECLPQRARCAFPCLRRRRSALPFLTEG
jgi:hypothetical protein